MDRKFSAQKEYELAEAKFLKNFWPKTHAILRTLFITFDGF